jgi:hypothetical protein
MGSVHEDMMAVANLIEELQVPPAYNPTCKGLYMAPIYTHTHIYIYIYAVFIYIYGCHLHALQIYAARGGLPLIATGAQAGSPCTLKVSYGTSRQRLMIL